MSLSIDQLALAASQRRVAELESALAASELKAANAIAHEQFALRCHHEAASAIEQVRGLVADWDNVSRINLEQALAPAGTIPEPPRGPSGVSSPPRHEVVLHVHHFDMENHAESFNGGYEAAVTQGLADDPTLAQEWLDAHDAEVATRALSNVLLAAHIPTGPIGIAPNIADADYMDEAARHLRDGFPVGGSGVTAAVARVLRVVGGELRAAEPQAHDRPPKGTPHA